MAIDLRLPHRIPQKIRQIKSYFGNIRRFASLAIGHHAWKLTTKSLWGFERMATLRRQVGAMVRHYRERAGLTQTELGELVGKSLETIGRIERGASAPSLALIEKLADALKIDARDLLGAGNYALKTKPHDPLGRLIEKLAALPDDEIERAEKVLAAAMDWGPRSKRS